VVAFGECEASRTPFSAFTLAISFLAITTNSGRDSSITPRTGAFFSMAG
jgi:hypothetical protein